MAVLATGWSRESVSQSDRGETGNERIWGIPHTECEVVALLEAEWMVDFPPERSGLAGSDLLILGVLLQQMGSLGALHVAEGVAKRLRVISWRERRIRSTWSNCV